jgi:His/Glu/Gln/Arg/opine family amino acid ABC transporter permease subunit
VDAVVENFFNASVFRQSLTLIGLGIVALLQLVACAFVLALVVGAILAWMRLSGWRLLVAAQIWIVDVARALPPLVTLVVVFYLVPPINGFTLDTFSAAVVTFGVVQGAYISEIYRGGLAAVPRGQYEAATALGMKASTSARWVIAPQVFRVILPPMTSQLTQLVRDSSLTYFIGYAEVVTRAKQAVTLTSNSTPYTMAIVVYAVLLISMQLLSSHLERRQSRTQSVSFSAAMGTANVDPGPTSNGALDASNIQKETP